MKLRRSLYSHPKPFSEDSSAPRGAASYRAVLRSCPVAAAVRAALAGAVSASPPWVAERRRRCNPRRPAAQPMVAVAMAVAVAVQGVRTPMPVVALSASCVRRADVRPMVGRPSAVHVSGVQRDRCDLDVRTDTCPVSEASASALSVVCPTQARPKRRWPYTAPRASTAGLAAASPARGCGATLAAWSTNRAGPAGGCPAGWLGNTTESKYRQVLPQVRPGPVAGWRPDHRAEPEGGDYAPWSSWWGRGRAGQRRRIPSGGRGKSAAAARPRRTKSAVHRERTAL